MAESFWEAARRQTLLDNADTLGDHTGLRVNMRSIRMETAAVSQESGSTNSGRLRSTGNVW